MNPRLKDIYDKKIVSALMAKLKYKNKNQVPKLLKIILNMGLGADASDGKKNKNLCGGYVFNKWAKSSYHQV